MSFNFLLATPHGSLTTIGRNVASVGSAFLGVSCVLFPSMLGVPIWSAVVYGLVGLALIGVFVFHLVRWKPISRRAKREAESMGALSATAFMQLKLFHANKDIPDYVGSGWLIFLEDRILVRFLRPRASSGKEGGSEEIALQNVAKVSRTEETSVEYAALVVVLSTGAKYAFTLVPNGESGWRGPTEEETEEFRDNIQRLLDKKD